MNLKRLEVFLEFIIFGVIMNLVESLIIVVLVTGQSISLKTIGIATLVVIPFAALGELIIDKTNWIPIKKKK